MNRNELSQKQLDWLCSTQYNNDAHQLSVDLEKEPEYILELLRFCPAALNAVHFVPPHHFGSFVESPMSTYDMEDLSTLERKQIPVDKIRCTQWRVFSDAVEYYRQAYLNEDTVAPIMVHFDSKTGLYFVKDGHHRLFAHHSLRRGLVDVTLSQTGMPQARNIHAVREMKMVSR